MNYKNLNDSELHATLLNSVQEEKNLLTQILSLLKEVDTRKLYCDFKCRSLFDYATKILKYSEAEAYTRMSAMRLIKEIPEVENHIKDGSLTLTNAAQAQSFFKREEKYLKTKPLDRDHVSNTNLTMNLSCVIQDHEPHTEPLKEFNSQRENELLKNDQQKIKTQAFTKEHKEAILAQLKNRSTRQAKEILNEISSIQVSDPDSIKQLSNGRIELKFSINANTLEKIKKVKSVLRLHEDLSLEEFMNKICDSILCEVETPAPLKVRVTNKTLTPKMKLYIKARDNHTCKNCGQSTDLAVDHIKPHALGGSHHPNNLQTLCRSCNIRRAIKTYGIDQIQRVIKLK